MCKVNGQNCNLKEKLRKVDETVASFPILIVQTIRVCHVATQRVNGSQKQKKCLSKQECNEDALRTAEGGKGMRRGYPSGKVEMRYRHNLGIF